MCPAGPHHQSLATRAHAATHGALTRWPPSACLVTHSTLPRRLCASVGHALLQLPRRRGARPHRQPAAAAARHHQVVADIGEDEEGQVLAGLEGAAHGARRERGGLVGRGWRGLEQGAGGFLWEVRGPLRLPAGPPAGRGAHLASIFFLSGISSLPPSTLMRRVSKSKNNFFLPKKRGERGKGGAAQGGGTERSGLRQHQEVCGGGGTGCSGAGRAACTQSGRQRCAPLEGVGAPEGQRRQPAKEDAVLDVRPASEVGGLLRGLASSVYVPCGHHNAAAACMHTAAWRLAPHILGGVPPLHRRDREVAALGACRREVAPQWKKTRGPTGAVRRGGAAQQTRHSPCSARRAPTHPTSTQPAAHHPYCP